MSESAIYNWIIMINFVQKTPQYWHSQGVAFALG